MRELETERLLMRQWREQDFEAYAKFYSDPEEARFVGGHRKRELAWRSMAAMAGHWSLKGHGYWVLEEKQSGVFAGALGLWRSDGWPELELGYWLVPKMRGKGYVTEAGSKAKDIAFNHLGAETLVSYIHPENEPSKRAAIRLGAVYEKTFDFLEFGPHCVYRYPKP